MIDITGLNKAEVLAALYNHSHPQAWGYLHATHEDMTREEAQAILERAAKEHTDFFDYLHGRVMRIHLGSDTQLNPRLYDRDNGQGAAQRAIDGLRVSV